MKLPKPLEVYDPNGVVFYPFHCVAVPTRQLTGGERQSALERLQTGKEPPSVVKRYTSAWLNRYEQEPTLGNCWQYHDMVSRLARMGRLGMFIVVNGQLWCTPTLGKKEIEMVATSMRLGTPERAWFTVLAVACRYQVGDWLLQLSNVAWEQVRHAPSLIEV